MKDNIVEIFFEVAKKYASNTAIVHKKKQISYGDLASKVESTSQYLLKNGLKKGDNILVFVPMSIELYTVVLALFSIGATVVFVDEWAKKERLEKAIQVVNIDVIIAPRKLIWLAYFLPGFRKIKRKLSIPTKIPSASHRYITTEKDNTALITFTTGSTGIPKAADRTHQFLWEQFRILKDEIRAKEGDRCLITLPIVLLSILGTGATGYIADFNQKKPHKLDADKQVVFAEKHQISILIASPYFIEQLAEVGTKRMPLMKRIITGGAPVFPKLARLIQSSFPDCDNVITYGSTEAEPISQLSMDSLMKSYSALDMGLCVGELHPDIQCKIIHITDQAINLKNDDWSEWELTSGELGEIIVTGPHVLDRYYNSKKAFREHKIQLKNAVWHRTGDSGKFIDGKLYLHGRCTQLIRHEERLISPFIVENQLIEIEEIKIGTLIKLDRELIVCVEVEKNTHASIINDILKQKNIPFDRLSLFDNIPRDQRHFSKIDYKQLKELLLKK